MAHTLIDAMLATAIIVVWQRLYGAEETGWLSALLRLLGFVPAVVHMAWAQVALAQGDTEHHATWVSPLWVGLGAFACVGLLGLSCVAALHLGWLAHEWSGVLGYVVPLVVWQGSACLTAAFSHLPFQTQVARDYSWACMALGMLQAIVLFVPVCLSVTMSAELHMTAFAALSGLGLLGMTLWSAQLKR
jgi:uncharacterized membrane protein YqaE (UPF0057 family)